MFQLTLGMKVLTSPLVSIISPQPAPAGEAVEQSTGLFDSQSNMFLTFMIFLCGIYGVAVLAGLSYQYLIFIPGKKKGKEIHFFGVKIERMRSAKLYKLEIINTSLRHFIISST